MASNGTASASALPETTPAGASVGCAVGLTSTIADEVPDLASASPAPLCAVDAPQGVRVHYGTCSDAVTLAVVYDASSGMGWHAVAFPANAATCAPQCMMAPASALVLDGDAVAAGDLTAYSNPTPATTWSTQTSGAGTLNGTHNYYFATVLIADVPELKEAMGATPSALGILWAHGSGNAFTGGFASYHGPKNRGSVALPWPATSTAADGGGTGNVAQESAAAAPSAIAAPAWTTADFWKLHGILMILAWCVCIPLGMSLAHGMRKHAPGRARYALFVSHVVVQMAGVLAASAAIVIATFYFQTNASPKEAFEAFWKLDAPYAHGKVGAAVMVAAWVQAINGLARPHQKEHTTVLRAAWEWGHHLLGLSIAALAILNVATGVALLGVLYRVVDVGVWGGGAAVGLGGVLLAAHAGEMAVARS